MIELAKHFTPYQIIVFIVLLAAAIKGTADFYDWAKSRLKEYFDKDYKSQQEKMTEEERFEETENRIESLEQDQEVIIGTLDKLNDKMDMLIDSDKDDIKSFLTREHHYFCYTQGWIDDYSLECCERRYAHYRDEGGNSFIEGFMKELRALPKHPPNDSNNNLRN